MVGICQQGLFSVAGKDYMRRVKVVNITYGVRDFVWVDFPENAQKPEFIGIHPAVVISIKNNNRIPYLVLPATSKAQDTTDPYVWKLIKRLRVDMVDTWVICSHIYAVAHTRIQKRASPLKVDQHDFDQIGQRCCIRLPFEYSEK
ncbi:MAG: hypothetical protein COA47_01575 [Robiginitomaculum sp.]|nr:MAG: hypothetical protein COA47_01575 [Robiginitomaculum sp.]